MWVRKEKVTVVKEKGKSGMLMKEDKMSSDCQLRQSLQTGLSLEGLNNSRDKKQGRGERWKGGQSRQGER